MLLCPNASCTPESCFGCAAILRITGGMEQFENRVADASRSVGKPVRFRLLGIAKHGHE
jgi:hypothetical protein